MISSKVGPPVRGDDFFDREQEQRQIWEYLRSDDLLLLAPRRVGKTSLMLRLHDTAGERNLEAALVSVAGAVDEVGFVRKLYESVSKLDSGTEVLKRLGKGPVGRYLSRVKKMSVSGFAVEFGEGDPWEELGAALAEALDQHRGRRLFLIDEVPVFVLELVRQDPSGERARRFLSWFRELRQNPERRGGLHWLLAGSVGLDTVAARLGLGDTINDFYLVRLGPFDRETAKSFLARLSAAYSFPIQEDALEHALDRVGWLIPYYLQLLFRELREYCTRSEVAADVEAVDRVYEDLLSAPKKGYFDYWRQRLPEEIGKSDAGLALLLLNAAAVDPNGVTRSSLEQLLAERVIDPDARGEKLSYLLDVLENDGYLVEEEKRYRFRSPLLREFWLRRVVP
ncbi:MAG: ATP-binding protein [Acidobacteriota bacterium]